MPFGLKIYKQHEDSKREVRGKKGGDETMSRKRSGRREERGETKGKAIDEHRV